MVANLDVAWVFGFDLTTFVVSLICFGLAKAVAPPEAPERTSLR